MAQTLQISGDLPDALSSNCHLSLAQVWGSSPALPLPHLTSLILLLVCLNKLIPWSIPQELIPSIAMSPHPAPFIPCRTSLPLPGSLGSFLPLPKPPSSPPPPLLNLNPYFSHREYYSWLAACGTKVCGTSLSLGMWQVKPVIISLLMTD